MSRDATHRARTLVVAPRWLRHGGFLLLMFAGVATMVVLRRSDLDLEEDLIAAGVLTICFWLLGLGLGSLVRNVIAGHALRLDAAGLHVPGLDVIPWPTVHGAELQGHGEDGERFRQLVVHTEVFRDAVSWRLYERYLFGPWAGLYGSQGKVVVPVGLLAIEPESLLAATREFVASARARPALGHDAASAAAERRASGRRLP